MKKKREFRYFTIADWVKEQNYLREMNKNGWKFVKVSGLGMYHFEECTPEDVIYQLDYNQEGVAHKEEYVQMFEDCGWEYMQDYFGYSYFRKSANEMQEVEEIFCDDSSRMDMMKRVFRGRMLPLVIFFCCFILPQFTLQLYHQGPAVENWLSVIGVIGILYLFIFVNFGYQYWKLWKKLNRKGN